VPNLRNPKTLKLVQLDTNFFRKESLTFFFLQGAMMEISDGDTTTDSSSLELLEGAKLRVCENLNDYAKKNNGP